MEDTAAQTIIRLGIGNDTVVVGIVPLINDPGNKTLEFTLGVPIADIDNLTNGNSHDVTIYGGTDDDQFEVNHNAAKLYLSGEAGDDTFIINTFLVLTDGSTQDIANLATLFGGSGNNRYSYLQNAPVFISGGPGIDTVVINGTPIGDVFIITKNFVVGAGRIVSFTGIERLEVNGAGGDDKIYVLSSPKELEITVRGGTGNDEIHLGGDPPTLIFDPPAFSYQPPAFQVQDAPVPGRELFTLNLGRVTFRLGGFWWDFGNPSTSDVRSAIEGFLNFHLFVLSLVLPGLTEAPGFNLDTFISTRASSPVRIDTSYHFWFWGRRSFVTVDLSGIELEFDGKVLPPLRTVVPPLVQVDPPPFAFKQDAVFDMTGIKGRITIDGGEGFDGEAGDRIFVHDQGDNSGVTGEIGTTTLPNLKGEQFQIYSGPGSDIFVSLDSAFSGTENREFSDGGSGSFTETIYSPSAVPSGYTPSLVAGQVPVLNYNLTLGIRTLLTEKFSVPDAVVGQLDGIWDTVFTDEAAFRAELAARLNATDLADYEEVIVATATKFKVDASGNPVLEPGQVGVFETLFTQTEDATTGLDTRTFSTLKGLGLGTGDALDGTKFDGIEYSNIEEMTVMLGDGADTFTITESGDILLILSTAGGGDTVNIEDIGGPVRVMGGDGSDTLNVGHNVLDEIGDLLTIEGNSYLSESVDRVDYDQTIEIPGQQGVSLHDAVLNSEIRVFVNSDPLNNAGGYPIFTFIDAAGKTTKYTRQQLDQIVFRAGSDGVPSTTGPELWIRPAVQDSNGFLIEDLVQEVEDGVPIWRDTSANANRVAWTPGDWNNFPTGLLDYAHEDLLAIQDILDDFAQIFGISFFGTLAQQHRDVILLHIAPSLIPVNRVDSAGKPLTVSAIERFVSAVAATDTLNVVDTGDSAENTGNLTSNRITGLGMAADDPTMGIEYFGIETLNIGLGGNQDTFTIESTHFGVTNLAGNGGADVINVQDIDGVTTVNGGDGSDTINVGSNSQGTTGSPDSINTGTLDNIGALLTINGNDPDSAGSDILNVDDTGEGDTNTGTLTDTQITGLDMAGSITYGTFETLNIGLGSNVDTFTIESTHDGVTNLDGNDGGDIFNVRTISGQTTVDGGNGSDTFNVGNIAGTLNSIFVALILNGNDPTSGSDVLNVDDTGDTEANTGDLAGTLTATQITGLGMASGITYGTIETLNIGLGSNQDRFTIFSTHVGVTNLDGNDGADIINVRTISGTTTVNVGAGADTVNVGSIAAGVAGNPDINSGGTVNGISALLTVDGGGGVDRDRLTVDDTFDSATNTGVLTGSSLTGLGMGNANQSAVNAALGITYTKFEDLFISPGSGADIFSIITTHNSTTAGGQSETTTLNAGAGTDTIHINAVSDNLVVNGQDHADIINVRTISGPTTVDAGDGADTVNVGTNAQGTVGSPGNNGNGTLNGIGALLTINGNDSGSDVLNVDDTGDDAQNTGNLTETRITGLGMAADDSTKGIEYSGIETLNIGLGSKVDTFTIESTHDGVTNVDGNDGGDIFNVRTIGGQTTVDGNNDSDTFNVGDSVNNISAALILNGNDPTSGSDVLNVDDTGDTEANTGDLAGTLTETEITGLGMASGITYGTIETLNIGLGSNQDRFTIFSTHVGVTNLDGNDGADIINVRTISGTTTVNTDSGAATVNVGSIAAGIAGNPDINSGGTVNGIAALLTLDGGGTGGDRDRLTVDDTADLAANTGILTESRLTGLGMGSLDQSVVADALGITYTTFEDLFISLGSGADVFTIITTHNSTTIDGQPATTTLNAGAGTDTIHINDVSDNLVVNGQDHPDTINIKGTGATSHSTLNGNGGDDVFNVHAMDGPVNVRGGAGSDTVNVTDRAPVLPAVLPLGTRTTPNGSIDRINALLDVHGGDGALDVMNVDDSRAAAANNKTGTLTATRLSGLELDVWIDYLALEELNIWLGFGANTFHIDSTHETETTLNTAEGGDTINVNGASGLVTVNAEQGDDFVNVRATDVDSELRINGHEGLDTINLSNLSPTLPAPYPAVLQPPAAGSIGNIDAIGGLVVIDGGDEFDTINVDDSGNLTAKPGTLTLDTLRGLALPAGVNYVGAEDFNLWLGKGADVLFIASTHAGTTQVFGGDGNATTNQRDDTIAINTISGVTTVHGQAGNDFIEVNVDALTLPEDAAFGSLEPITGFFDRTHLNGLGAVLNLHGEGDSDQYTLNFAGAGDALVNVHDNGAENNGVDTLIINGADIVADVDNQPNDTFLLRRDFVVLLNESVPGDGFDRVERANYDQNINARLIVNGLGGDDKIVADDNSSITTLDGGDGRDTFQIGQVFGTPRDGASANVAPGDTVDTTPVIIGVIKDPLKDPTDPSAVIFDPTSFDPITSVLSEATIDAINDAIDVQVAKNEALDGIAYVSDGVSHATTIFGGDGGDVFNVYHNKGTLRLEGEAGNDEFIVRAFVTVDLSVQADTEINGGGGADIINYAINAPVSLDGGAGFDTVVVLGTPFPDNFVVTSDGIFGAGLNVTFANIESAELDTLEGDDTIYILGTGADFVTTVIGGLGDDTIEVMGDVLGTVISDDLLGRSGVITHGVASEDPAFDNVGVNGVFVNVLSLAAESLVSIRPTGDPLLVTEDGTLVASYLISLVTPDSAELAAELAAALAANPVYLTVSAGIVSSEDRSNGGAGILVSVNAGAFTNAVVLTFDGTPANEEFEISVMAVEDSGEEGPRLALISHSINSGDPAFDDLPIIDVFVDVVDNDKPGLDIRHLEEQGNGSFLPNNSTQVLEGDPTFGFDDVYSVVLTRAPGDDVTVNLNTDGQIIASPLAGGSSLVFNDTNWKVPQLVRVTAAEDGLDGVEISTITHEIVSSGIFGSIPSAEYPELDVTVFDDETPGVIVQETDGSTVVVDGGHNDSYRVRLTRAPDGEVTLTLRTDTQTFLSTNSDFETEDENVESGFFEYTYIFDGTNWSQWVDIDVRANSAFEGTNDKAKVFAPQAQNLDQIRGPLIIEGGVGPGDARALLEPILLPGETNDVSAQNAASTTEAGDIDTLNVFHTDNSDADTGNLFYRTVDGEPNANAIANAGLALTGFEMGGDFSVDEGTPGTPKIVYYGGGITLNGFEVVEILLGKGDETLNISDTGDRDEKAEVADDPATITAVHGGGGSDTIMISGRGNGPLVVYGDTSQDRARYGNDAPVASIHGTSFANDGDDTIDARAMGDQNDGFVGLVAYGGFGNDTIWGSQGDDHLAGGTSAQLGRDFIDGQAGDDHIYGDSHFNVDLQLFSEDQVAAFANSDPRVAEMFEVLDETPGDDNYLGTDDYRESAGVDEIRGGAGADIIFGDHGVITLAEGTRRLTTTSSIVRLDTVQPTFGGDDIIYGHTDVSAGPADDAVGDRIFGGQGGDFIEAGNRNNVVLGDHGFINLGVADSDIDRIESTETTFAGGADTIFTGANDDIVIGGRFGDKITIEDGNNIVFGDSGFVLYQNGGPLLGKIASLYLDGSGTFIQGGDDVIRVGVSDGSNGLGNDIVIAGLGDDKVTIGNGNNIAFGDEGSVTFQPDGTLRALITSLYLDNVTGIAGRSVLNAPESGVGVGKDTINTGIGNDVIIGGLGLDTITVVDGSNTVLGDEGFVKYQTGESLLDEVTSLYLDGSGTFIQGGDDVIRVGVSDGSNGLGNDIVIAGLGDDRVTIGNGNNIAFGDEGSVTFQPDGTLRALITSLYLDNVTGIAGRSVLNAPESGVGVGKDTINTGIGNDVIIGGLGLDTITVVDGSNTVLGDEGFVKYQTGESLLDEVTSLYLDGSGTFIQGGDDVIRVGVSDGSNGLGNDIVIAGLGDDRVTIGNGNNIAFGDEGSVTFQPDGTLRALITSLYLDNVTGIASRSVLNAPESGVGVGKDTINTGIGNDVIIGGLGLDTITVVDGSNTVLGDEGFVKYQTGESLLDEVTSLYLDGSGTFIQGGDDVIRVGVSDGSNGLGNDIVIAGLGDDRVMIGNGNNIAFGDEGSVTFQPDGTLRALITSLYLDNVTGIAGRSVLNAPESGVGVGKDTINTGIGNDVIIGGLGLDTITVVDGSNTVLGDEGFVKYQTGESLLDEVTSLYLDGSGTFIQGGDDVIRVGVGDGSNGLGNDIVIAGLGNDTVTIGNGNNIAFGDEGSVTFQLGSTLRARIENTVLGDEGLYLDDDGLSALDVEPIEAVVGNDTITTGSGADVIIGGLGIDTITVTDGSNTVLGDEGFVQYQDQNDPAPNAIELPGTVSSLYLDLAGTFIQGGADVIRVGVSEGSYGDYALDEP